MTGTSPATAKIVIFGAYKTGTTGLFYKIANSLPAPPRVFFEKPVYLPEPGDEKRWVLAKTILWHEDGGSTVDYESFLSFDKKIYLVRDPRDWIVSGTLFFIQKEPSLYKNDFKMGKILDALHQKMCDPAKISLKSLLKLLMDLSDVDDFNLTVEWIRKHYAWLPRFESRLNGYCRLRYEDFVDERIEHVEKYLGLPMSGAAQVTSDHDHVPRTKGYGNWRDWFVSEDVDFFRPLFQEYMERYGYGDEWRLNKKPSILPEHCTHYVIRTVNKRRDNPLPPRYRWRASFLKNWFAGRR